MEVANNNRSDHPEKEQRGNNTENTIFPELLLTMDGQHMSFTAMRAMTPHWLASDIVQLRIKALLAVITHWPRHENS